MTNLSSDAIERKVLAFFFKAPYHMRLLRVDLNMFALEKNRNLAEVMQRYVIKYRQPPTKESLVLFCNELVSGNAALDRYSEALLLMDELPEVEDKEFDFCYDKAENYLVGRKIFDAAENLKSQFEKYDELDFKDVRRDMVNRLIAIKDGRDNILRGFVYSRAKESWNKYQYLASGGHDDDLLPFGIDALDSQLGGMRRTFVTLLYSETSGGKSRTAINIAYNAALSGYNVVFFSLEMAFPLIAACIASRMAMVDSKKIIFGKLNDPDRMKYKKALIKQVREKLGIWIVDIPSGMQSYHIVSELETYRAATGLIPDFVVVDYANLVKPVDRFQDRSERYDVLFREFHEIARSQNITLLTATKQSREATKAFKEHPRKQQEVEGTDNIGLSDNIAFHCEIVIHLRQTEHDRLQNRMWAVVNKDRYGVRNIEIPLFTLWDLTYVGDRKISGTGNKGVVLRKEPK